MVTKIHNDYDQLFDFLGIAPGGLFVTQIELRLWGKKLLLHFRYNISGDDKLFTLLFENCSAIRWEDVGSDIDEQDTHADVIGTIMGEDKHRKPAVITTTLFEIAITYGELVLQKDW